MVQWGATHSAGPAVMAGLDVEMPNAAYLNADSLSAAIDDGSLTTARVDDAAGRVLNALFTIGAFDEVNLNTPDNMVASAEHHAIAAQLSAAGTVMLKNEGGFLPVTLPEAGPPLKILLVGHEAHDLNETVGGGGSGAVSPSNTTTPLDGILQHVGIDPTTDATASWACNSANTACVRFKDVTATAHIAEAAILAGTATHIFIFVATTSTEGLDRETLGLSGVCQATQVVSFWLPVNSCANPYPDVDQDTMISAVLGAQNGEAGAKTAVIAVAPGALLTPWRDQAAAVLIPFMPGQAYGIAIASILFVRAATTHTQLTRSILRPQHLSDECALQGDVSPTGRLPVTFPTTDTQQVVPKSAFPGLLNGADYECSMLGQVCPPGAVSQYSEQLLVGYRWFNQNEVEPAYCFGHGVGFVRAQRRPLAATCHPSTRWPHSLV